MSESLRIPRILTCPCCQARLRWPGQESGRIRCPRCRTRLIALLHRGNCRVLAEDANTIDQMICDWVRLEHADEEEDEDERENLTTAPAPDTTEPAGEILVQPVNLTTVSPAAPPDSPDPQEPPLRKAG